MWRYTISRPIRSTPAHLAQHPSCTAIVSHHFDADDPDDREATRRASVAARCLRFLSRCL
ncbi:hypothetical protein [Conexibacter sp. CPCC 206217]|uniref:hypothetical protein n=1 Tax=Conexibacter sp. CPCC 206217 TaxID=3064574 RepID=UPI002722CCBF|nr:hypothetical protein [Conexibacter sp. CPCC 206217]MDO8213524.1 hypothetical protein [Conexibacter sp. CPCC 206217]